MVIRRGDVTDIAWILRGFCVVGNELPYNLTTGDVLIICHGKSKLSVLASHKPPGHR